jgi:hypothetical protein
MKIKEYRIEETQERLWCDGKMHFRFRPEDAHMRVDSTCDGRCHQKRSLEFQRELELDLPRFRQAMLAIVRWGRWVSCPAGR